ncbi:hypothetical protein [Actinomadura sp. 9N215]|uniref:hypothetical protein n=1 Tax=Actinomadura sp. 9N215 TaxID=3375150 RepID=UPI0037A9F5F5
MGQASLTGYRLRRTIRHRYLKWHTERNRDTAIRYLDALALTLERNGWRCVKTYTPDVVPVHTPLLRVYGTGSAVLTINVMAVPGRRWAYHEASRGRTGYLCDCGADLKDITHVIEQFQRNHP